MDDFAKAFILTIRVRFSFPGGLTSFLALAVLSVGLTVATAGDASVPADHSKRMAAGLELFKSSVGQLLKEHCLECHGAGKNKGDLDLGTREGLLKGGADGPAIVVGNAAQSRVIKLISHSEDPHMPHKKAKLPGEAIRQIAQWINDGAPYAQPLVGNAKVVKDRTQVTEADRRFWSFLPLKAQEPPKLKGLRSRSWARNPVDQFILSELDKKRITPNRAIEPRKLIRRVYLDLLGLPPTPEEVEAFVRNKSPKAYEELVDQLLSNPHFGERWARHWLDLARYGESHGYEQDYDRPFAYPYRDFVTRAFNDDLPYNKFVQWQLAGDELEPDNAQAWFATGFLGAGTHATQITANQAEKERYDELDDKINTMGTAMLGLTLGCARCHDHKFDPVPTMDYYSLISTFTATVRSDYDVDLDPAATRKARGGYDAVHKPLVQALEQFEKEQLTGRFDSWVNGDPKPAMPEWLTLELDGVRASGGYYGINSARKLDDDSWLISITAGTPDRINFSTKIGNAGAMLTNLVAIRIEALPDKSLPDWGPGWGRGGAFALQSISVSAKPLKGEGGPVNLNFKPRPEKPGKAAASDSLWSVGEAEDGRRAIVLVSDRPFGFESGTELSFDLGFVRDLNLLGRFRLSVGSNSAAQLDTPAFVRVKEFDDGIAALRGDISKRTASQKLALLRVYESTDAEWLKLATAIEQHEEHAPRPKMMKALVCSEGLPAIRLHTQGPDFYEKTYQLRRGDLSQKQGEASPSFLQVLMRTADKEKHWQQPKPAESRTPMMRSALARWITDVNDGAGNLLARVIVNRLWQHHFGRGIVATPSDFGAMGAPPTHPELLDWLARELVSHNWSLKHIHRLIMTSAVYMEDCSTDSRRLKVDAENHLWWHRDPMRLDAEPLRDSILAVSGRLDLTMYGPGTLDEGMNRRSIYFFIKRSKLIPWMTQFDWPDSLQGIGQRVNTTVAPQALLMMNNPHVRDAARDFADLLLGRTSDERSAIDLAYRRALGRPPATAEMNQALSFLGAQRATYAGDETKALRLALTDYCQVLFSLNEFVYAE